jgi:hypothetical protein
LVESINKFVVPPDDESAGDDVPTIRGDDEPLFDDAVALEPIPDVRPDDDDDG